MQIAAAQPTSTRRERWSWYLYDFGNSAYAAVVLLAVYATYFKEGVVGGAEGTRLWGISVGIAMLAVAVTAPVLGTIADFSGAKKRFLLFYTSLACLFTALLFFVQHGDVLIGMLFFILAEIGYRSAQVFYNSLLPEIASPEEMPRVSGNGWAVGSLGGIICLLIVLAAILRIGGGLIVRLSLVFTALFYAASTTPLFAWLQERAPRNNLPKGENYVTLALKRLGATFRKVRNFKQFLRFIVAFLVYNDGILMVLNFGAILGAVLYGMEQEDIIIFMIIVQVASVAGAYLFGLVADDFGNKRSLIVALLLMVAAVVWLYFNYSRLGFYVIGGVAGFALTGVQSVSRTVVGTLSPPGQSAEFYGFFAVAGRTSSFIGPTIFGFVAAGATQRFLSQGRGDLLAEQMGHRVALFTIVAFLLVGLGLLMWVNEGKARAETNAAASESAA